MPWFWNLIIDVSISPPPFFSEKKYYFQEGRKAEDIRHIWEKSTILLMPLKYTENGTKDVRRAMAGKVAWSQIGSCYIKLRGYI